MSAPDVPPTALSIAGSDSGGGAGIQADLRTFFACRVHGMTAVTAVTVQNSLGVTGFTEIDPETVVAQIEAVSGDMGVAAAKTGMLPTAEIIRAVARCCDRVGIGTGGSPLVVDPVAASMTGHALVRQDALAAIRQELLPRASVVTPNTDEVRMLTGTEVRTRKQQREAAAALHALGPETVLVKGGHMSEPRCVDLLYDGETFLELPSVRQQTTNTHGGGDTMAAAITAGLARGMRVPQAVRFGKDFVTRAVEHSYPMGAGVGPVSAFWRLAAE